MNATTNLQINKLYIFYFIKKFNKKCFDMIVMLLNRNRRWPRITIILLKLHYENKLLRVLNKNEINMIYL